MTSQEKLYRDIETLKDSIQRNWYEINTKPLSLEERQGIKKNIKWCLDKLGSLYEKLEQ